VVDGAGRLTVDMQGRRRLGVGGRGEDAEPRIGTAEQSDSPERRSRPETGVGGGETEERMPRIAESDTTVTPFAADEVPRREQEQRGDGWRRNEDRSFPDLLLN